MQEKILIIEDEVIIATDIQAHLIELGYQVEGIIHRSEEAIDYLSFHTPDLVLCDINIKGELDGIEVALKIRAVKKIPFVFLTSFADRKTLERAKKVLPYGYIVKPFVRKDLLSAIELATYKFNQELEQLKITKLKADGLCESPMTDKEYEVLYCMTEGKSYEVIANQLKISRNTLKYHIKNIFFKFGASNKAEVLQKMLAHITT